LRAKLLWIALAVLAIVRAASAQAPDADALLRRAFENYRAQSSQSTVAMTVHRPEWERTFAMTAWTRGDNDALVRFTAPQKDAGNATLKLGNDMWVFDPKLNQVIKLPPSMMAQSWMGSDFSYNDLAKSEELLADYTHRIVAAEKIGDHQIWTVDSLPKPGAPVVWGKVTVKLRDDLVIAEETFFDQDMKPVRRMTADSIAPLGGRAYPVVMTMHPLDSAGAWTRVETSEATFNPALPDWLFTLSNLQNPRR